VLTAQGQEGEECIGHQTCAPGLYCTRADTLEACESESGYCCTRICGLSSGPGCPEPLECSPLFVFPIPPEPSCSPGIGICLAVQE
jgi:hypothetical protein